MPRTRRTFTNEFMREAVKLVKQPGAKITHIALALCIEQSVLRRWFIQEHGGVLDMRPNKPLRSESASEVERCRRRLNFDPPGDACENLDYQEDVHVFLRIPNLSR